MAIYVKITGKKQGWIKGAVTATNFVDYIEVHTLEFGEGSPVNAHLGTATGHRVARPIHITKPLDKSSPLLLTSCDTNEAVTVVFVYTKEGAEHKSLVQVELTNALINDFNHAGAANGTALETLIFSYQKLDFTWMDGGIASSIDWSASAT